MEKTVSVIMGTYNGEKYIREQLDSILSQTYSIKEIIIQDDGSTDGTVRICEEYAEIYSNVLFLETRETWALISTLSRQHRGRRGFRGHLRPR